MDLEAVIKDELSLYADAVQKVRDRIDSTYTYALDLMFNCKGKIILTGMGKTGIIAKKIAATLSSTGTTAIFLHAAEGIHGDLGIIDKKDLIIAVSYSGNNRELVSLIPYFKFNRNSIIAITGNKSSQLASNSDVVLDSSVPLGYEPFNLVPTASTTVSLAIGDALAVALLRKRNFQVNDFAKFHPGGTIGKKLLLKVKDLMHSGKTNPMVNESVSMDQVIVEMTTKGLGCTNVIDQFGKLIGIVTDGDLRRMLAKGGDVLKLNVTEAMTKDPRTVMSSVLAVEALNIMECLKITMLPVVNDNHEPVGMLHMHDLIDAGVVS